MSGIVVSQPIALVDNPVLSRIIVAKGGTEVIAALMLAAARRIAEISRINVEREGVAAARLLKSVVCMFKVEFSIY